MPDISPHELIMGNQGAQKSSFIDDIERWSATGLPSFFRKIAWKRRWAEVIE